MLVYSFSWCLLSYCCSFTYTRICCLYNRRRFVYQTLYTRTHPSQARVGNVLPSDVTYRVPKNWHHFCTP